MTIDATSSATDLAAVAAASNAATSSSAQATGGQQTLGQDAFLKLLVAQLKYQDPMNPVQGAEFVAQTAQFSSVEKLTEMSQMNTEMLLVQKMSQAAGLVGRTVSYTGSDGSEATGVVASAQLLASGPVLRVGTEDVPLSSVTTVRETASPSSTQTS